MGFVVCFILVSNERSILLILKWTTFSYFVFHLEKSVLELLDHVLFFVLNITELRVSATSKACQLFEVALFAIGLSKQLFLWAILVYLNFLFRSWNCWSFWCLRLRAIDNARSKVIVNLLHLCCCSLFDFTLHTDRACGSLSCKLAIACERSVGCPVSNWWHCFDKRLILLLRIRRNGPCLVHLQLFGDLEGSELLLARGVLIVCSSRKLVNYFAA